jgi:hypothetical protein
VDLTSRYLGLVVVPGKYVTKIEVEEFASQLRREVHVQGMGVKTEGIGESMRIA